MKIAIDCRSLDWKHSGIARYLDNILKELATLDKANEYYLLFPRKSKASYHFAKSKTIYFLANDFIYKFWKTPKFLKKEKIDIYWSPTQELPFWKPKYTRYFITIHDAAMEHDISSQTLKVKILHFLMVYKFSAGIADVIFTDSNYSKNDIANSLKINKSKIVVTFIGVDKKFKPIEKQSARLKLNKKFGIDSQYIFYINTGKPKNLLNAYAQLINNKWKNIDINLVTLGKSVNKEEDIELLAKEFNIERRIKHINYHVSEEELNTLYSGSEFFICPSYFEGFGLTPLEALKCGVPILVSDVTCLPEIFQNAALYCDPNNYSDIANKMALFIEKPKIKKEILSNSKKLLSLYSWDNIARNILSNLNS